MRKEETEDREIKVTARSYKGWAKILISLVAISYVCFHLYTGYSGPFPNLQQLRIEK